MDKKYENIKQIVDEKLSCSAHNLDHVMRVYKLCLEISKYEESVDLDILIPAALLHDIARVSESNDKSGKIDHAVLGSEMAGEILDQLGYEDQKIDKIKHCIKTHRYRTGNIPETIEAKILFDADKLDAIGAVGIARCLMISGQSGQRLLDIENVEEYLVLNTTKNGRIKDLSKHSPILEYEIKLKKIPAKLYTKRAKIIGSKRINYMDDFFKTLKLEMN